jgi:transcriptional regulator with XRE-family HTH domain
VPRRAKNISNDTAFRIRELRKKQGLTQKQLADMLYKSESTIRMWELGKSEPDNQTIRQLAEIFNVSSSYIIGEENSAVSAIHTIASPNKNGIVFIRARDGSIVESELDDDQIDLFKNMLKQINDKNK